MWDFIQEDWAFFKTLAGLPNVVFTKEGGLKKRQTPGLYLGGLLIGNGWAR